VLNTLVRARALDSYSTIKACVVYMYGDLQFAIGPAPQPQPNVMSAASSTPGNRLNP